MGVADGVERGADPRASQLPVVLDDATSDERLRLLVENVEEYAILMLDTDGGVASWNAGAHRLKGYVAEEIIGRHFSVFYPQEDVAAGKPERELQIAAAEGRLEDEGWRVTKDGTPFWANVVITALRDVDGTLRGYGKIIHDLTERRAAEQSQLAAHVLFETAFADAPIGMALVGLDGSWLKVNRALCQIVGWSEDELLARTFQDITHPDDLHADLEHVVALMRGDTGSYQMEKRYFTRSGDVIWIELSGTLVRDASGAPAHFIAQIQDITGSRRAERELEQKGLALAEAQAIAQIGSWSWDPQADVAVWSDEMYRIFGRDPVDGPATADDLFAYLHPDDRDRIAAGYAQAFGAGESFELEYRVVAGDGALRSLHGLGRREPSGRYVGTVQNVTELRSTEHSLKEAEELLALAFDHSPLGMTLSTPDHGVLRLNQAFADMLGYTVSELIADQHPARFTHPDDLAADRENIRLSLDDKEDRQWTKRYLHARGHSVWAQVSMSVLRYPDGSPRLLVSQIEDISERRRHEAEERALRNVAELVAAGAEPKIVFTAIADQVRHHFDSTVGAVVRFDAAARTGVMLGASSSDGTDLAGAIFDLQSATATAEVSRSGHPARVDAFALAAADPMSDTVQRFGLTASVAAPVRVGGVLWGAVGAASDQQIATGAELRLGRFAHLASLAIANFQTSELLEHRAATDSLTGIANHRTFYDRLESEVERARRHSRELSVVLLDLDHFKAVNDTHGHQMGDRLLREIADRLAAQVREGELIARIGGEEFAWLIPETNHHGAYAAAERMRRAIQTTAFAGVGFVTLSAGVCSRRHARDAQELVRFADRALYAAKDGGRNATVLYSPHLHADVRMTPGTPRATDAPDPPSECERPPGLTPQTPGAGAGAA